MKAPTSKSLLFIVLLTAATPSVAQVYKWVDSDGQTHFSHLPPAESQVRDESAVVQMREKENRRHTRNGKPYCGELELPSNDDPLYLLGEARSQRTNWSGQLRRRQERIEEVRQDQLSRRYHGGSGYRRRMDDLLAGIADLECGIRWTREKEAELQPAYAEFQENYRTAVEDFERYKNRCGPKPQTVGYTTDPMAKEWVRCQRAGSTGEHNRRLREVKRLKGLARFLDE